MAISVDKNYIRILDNKEHKITYIKSSKIYRIFQKKYSGQYETFVSNVNTIIKTLTEQMNSFCIKNNICELDETEVYKLNPIKDIISTKQVVLEDMQYIATCFTKHTYFDKTALKTGDYLYNIGLKDEWFIPIDTREEMLQDDTICSTDIKDKYEYLKTKFPGCKDC